MAYCRQCGGKLENDGDEICGACGARQREYLKLEIDVSKALFAGEADVLPLRVTNHTTEALSEMELSLSGVCFDDESECNVPTPPPGRDPRLLPQHLGRCLCFG